MPKVQGTRTKHPQSSAVSELQESFVTQWQRLRLISSYLFEDGIIEKDQSFERYWGKAWGPRAGAGEQML